MKTIKLSIKFQTIIFYISTFLYYSQICIATSDITKEKLPLITTPTHTATPTPTSFPLIETKTEKQTKDSIDKEDETRKQMMNWSRHLGVTCVFCHNQDNFKSDEKPSFKKALKHWQMVRLINEEVFTERDKGGTLKVEADCFMCHRGVSVPKYKEPPQNLMK